MNLKGFFVDLLFYVPADRRSVRIYRVKLMFVEALELCFIGGFMEPTSLNVNIDGVFCTP